MALKKNITVSGLMQLHTDAGALEQDGYQITMGGAYIKVQTVSASKDMATAFVTISGPEGRIDRKHQFTPSVADGAQNFIKQAYEHLKTLPEYAGSEDA